MATNLANGSLISRVNDASPVAYIAVTQVATIGLVGEESGLIDVTNLASTLREWRKQIPDGLELPCRAQWDELDATQVLIRDTDRAATVARSWRVTFTNSPATTATFNALVTRAVIADAEVSRNYRVTLTDSPAQTITFAGLVTNWSINQIVVDNVLTLNVTVKPTGDLTFA